MPDSSRVALLRSRRVDENRPVAAEEAPIGLLRDVDAQISFGERAALEGVLAQARPRLAIEIGTAEGGTLERLAHYSEEVVSLDLDCALARARQLPNVTFHEGDSHVLLPEVLRGIADEGRNVDFVFVDGDHSTEGVRRDVLDLLESPAVGSSLIIIHDTANEVVRAGVDGVPFEAFPKVKHVDLDFVVGYMFRDPPLRHEIWGGLGLVIVGQAPPAYPTPVRQSRYYEAFSLLSEGKLAVVARESSIEIEELMAARDQLESLRAELDQLRVWHRAVTTSLSWRITAPLRAVMQALRLVGGIPRRILRHGPCG